MAIEPVALTRELLHYNTINPPGMERACAEHLGRLLEGAGFSIQYESFAPDRTSLIASIGGSSEKPQLGFTGHIDIVPLGSAAWKHDPFAGELDGGRLYGRGSSDMKSGVAAFVAAAVELASQLQRGPGLRMVITAGEETGCQGAFELAKQDGVLGQVGALIVGEPTGNFPYVGHKGAFWLRAHTKGVTAHGSMPEHGVNAIYKAARALVVLEQFQFGVAQHQHLGLSSLNVGNITGGLNINSVPDAACIGIDIRTTPNVDHVALRARLQRELGDDVELETLLDVGSVFTDPAAPWIQSVFDTLTPYLGSRPEPRTATYFTDAAALNQVYRDPPTIILGPGEPQMAHQTDEYCLIDRVAQAQAVYRDLIQQWCRA